MMDDLRRNKPSEATPTGNLPGPGDILSQYYPCNTPKTILFSKNFC